MEIILAQPRGFCAGVERAIKIVEKALDLYPHKKIYVLHEIVHNQYILSLFRKRGVNFIESINDIPEQDIVLILSAHGTSRHIINTAQARFTIVIDATCPLVTKVHREIKHNAQANKENILIGHQGHQEVIGTMEQISQEVKLVQSIEGVRKLKVQNPNNLSYVTQTTLSIDDTKDIISALKNRFPNIKGPDLKDICYATQNRQNAVKELAKMTDIIFVIGSLNSSNSARLCEVARLQNIPSYLIDNHTAIDISWLQNIKKVGITAGASAPETLVQEIISFLKRKFANTTVSTMSGINENIRFKLPKF